ncbi:hypothetical protein AAE478_006367 [Parahypoxylon ruwenzoriense]
MRRSVAQRVLSFSIFLREALSLTPPAPLPPPDEVGQDALAVLADPGEAAIGIAYFEQYTDHRYPDFGTFNQTYWYNDAFWKGPGSPIILFTPGEIPATGYLTYLTDQVITDLTAKEIGGAVVMVEHRYWGNSTPYEIQSTKNLPFLNSDQTVTDFVHFAQTAKLPFDVDGGSNAPRSPWIWSGGSHSGALGYFDYWQYFYAIQQGMPQNCSQDSAAIIDHADNAFIHGLRKEQADLKQLFGLQKLACLGDAAAAISSPIWAWQSIQFTSGYSTFYQMCDAIEDVIPNSTAPMNASSNGVGIKKALPNFARWFQAQYLPGCNVACFDTYNATSPMFTDKTEANGFDRTWPARPRPLMRKISGAPINQPTMFSRLASAEYWQRQCELFFPREGKYTYASALGKKDYRQNQCPYKRNAVNPDIKKTQDDTVAQIATWTKEFYGLATRYWSFAE